MITWIAAMVLSAAHANCPYSEAELEYQYVPPRPMRILTNNPGPTEPKEAEFTCLSPADQTKFKAAMTKWLKSVVPKGQLLWGAIVWLSNHDKEINPETNKRVAYEIFEMAAMNGVAGPYTKDVQQYLPMIADAQDRQYFVDHLYDKAVATRGAADLVAYLKDQRPTQLAGGAVTPTAER